MAGWRALRPADLPALCRLAEAAHPSHPESPAVFAERLALAPGFCLALPGGEGLLGYAIAHPWAGPPPPLDSLLGALPEAPRALHLHDIALAEAARGMGLGREALVRLLGMARQAGLKEASLVAIAGKQGYWQGQGFTPAAAPGAALHGYGEGAVLMRRRLEQGVDRHEGA